MSFGILNYILIWFGLASLAVWIAFAVNFDRLRPGDGGFLIPTIMTMLGYGFLQAWYEIEITHFKRTWIELRTRLS